MSFLLRALRAALGALALLALLALAAPALAADQAGRWQVTAAAPLAPRYPAVTAWTGSRLLVWGGVDQSTFSTDGALYDPRSDTWHAMAESPLPPGWVTAAMWTGRELIVWGVTECTGRPGHCTDSSFADMGARYDPEADAWRSIAAYPALAPDGCDFLASGRGVWTGRLMLVWGDQLCGSSPDATAGAAYDPNRDEWTPIPPAPMPARANAAVAWTGSRMTVWGGAPVVTGDARADGASYDPVRERWDVMAASPLQARAAAASVWAGGRLLVLDGYVPGPGGLLSDGAVYDPARGAWQRVAPVPLSPRALPDVVAAGRDVFVWGGYADLTGDAVPGHLADGALYDVGADRWLALPPLPIGGASDAVWAGDRVLVWGSAQDLRGAAWFPPSGLLAGLPFPSLAAGAGGAALLMLVLGVALLAFRRRRRPVAAVQPQVVTAPAPAATDARPARFCGLCGRALVQGDRFCRGCGATAERS
jgi:N-acetylneuraminic acid mutarotase